MNRASTSVRSRADQSGGGGDLVVAAELRRDAFRLVVGFTAQRGKVLAVLGPNGSGKSTLLRAVAGLTPITSGRITLGGLVLDDATAVGQGVDAQPIEAARTTFMDPARRPVGFVFQDYRLFEHLSVLDNVAFAARSRGARRADARRQAMTWVHRLGLADLADRHPSALSGGQAQRVALARAFAREPQLLLLDEPMAALDARTRLDVQGQLRAHLADFPGPTVMVTHDPLDALVLADGLLVLEDGLVVQQGTPAEVTRRPVTEYVAKLVGLNLYTGQAAGTEIDVTGGGHLVAADRGNGAVLVAIRPSAVVLMTDRPVHASPRNTWPGRIAGLTLLADRVRVEVEGAPRILADVTPAAVAELGLTPGTQVWASVKATDLEVYQHGGRRPELAAGARIAP